MRGLSQLMVLSNPMVYQLTASIYMYIYIYVCMHVCMYIYIYIKKICYLHDLFIRVLSQAMVVISQ